MIYSWLVSIKEIFPQLHQEPLSSKAAGWTEESVLQLDIQIQTAAQMVKNSQENVYRLLPNSRIRSILKQQKTNKKNKTNNPYPDKWCTKLEMKASKMLKMTDLDRSNSKNRLVTVEKTGEMSWYE